MNRKINKKSIKSCWGIDNYLYETLVLNFQRLLSPTSPSNLPPHEVDGGYYSWEYPKLETLNKFIFEKEDGILDYYKLTKFTFDAPANIKWTGLQRVIINSNIVFHVRSFETNYNGIISKGVMCKYKLKSEKLNNTVLVTDRHLPDLTLIRRTKNGSNVIYTSLGGGLLLSTDPSLPAKDGFGFYKVLFSHKGLAGDNKLKFTNFCFIKEHIFKIIPWLDKPQTIETNKINNSIFYEIYVQKLKAPFFECCKFGVSKDSEHRSKTQHRKSMFAHQLMRVWKVKDSSDALTIEKLVKQNFKTGVCMKAWMEDGYTETCDIDDMDNIIKFIDRQVDLLYCEDQESIEEV